jgi:hypothetical protein
MGNVTRALKKIALTKRPCKNRREKNGHFPQNLLSCSKIAGVAQLVEQLICNQPVASSSLVTSLLARKGDARRV